MKIELKKVSINLTFSEETTMFKAELAVNGIIIGNAYNEGRGGCTFYESYAYGLTDEQIVRNKKLLAEAEAYCLSLPKVRVEDLDFEYDMNLEHFIDDLIEDELDKKERKQFEKKMVNHIMWGNPNALSYSQVKFKTPLSSIPTLYLQSCVNNYKKEFKEGVVFLNTNLESLGIKL